MRKFLLLTASVGALGLALTAAQAADVIPEPAPEPDWTAFHIGVGGGAGWNLYDANSQVCHEDDGDECFGGDPTAADGFFTLEADDLGAFYGFGTVEGGFDLQFDGSPIVVGVLANYDFNGDSSSDTDSLDDEDDGGDVSHSIEAELDDTWFVGGRLGFAFMNNSSLVYALGGYTWADGSVKSDFDGDFTASDGDHSETSFAEEDESVDGWTVGGGLETMLWENVSLKVEYRHDFLDKIEFEGQDDDGNDDDHTHTGEVDFSRDTVRAVLSWRLGDLF